jgi:uncharacterized repeat protein (TIGR01451 family)
VSPALPAGLSFSASNGQISGSPTTATSAASYAVTVTDSTSPQQTATKSFSLTVGKGSQTITFARPADVTFKQGGSFPLVASASSGLAVTFTSSTTSVCEVSGSILNVVAGGTCTITASQSGNDNWEQAAQVSQSFGIGQASQTISFTKPADATFSPGGTVALSATATSGLAVGFASTTTGVCTVLGSTATIVAAGTCTITASQAGNDNYAPAADVTLSFGIGKASQTISFTRPADTTFVPGGTVPLSASSSSGLAVTFASTTTGACTVSGSTATMVAGGACSITVSQAGNENYAAAAAVTQTFSIGKASQTITLTKPSNVTFKTGATVALSATATSGLAVSFVSQTASVCAVSGFTATLIAVGTCTIKASQAGDSRYAAAADVTVSFGALQPPGITASGTVEPQSFSAPGVTLVFTIVLKNSGGVAATGIRLADERLTNITCASTSLAPGESINCQGATLTTLADLSAGKISVSPKITYTYAEVVP